MVDPTSVDQHRSADPWRRIEQRAQSTDFADAIRRASQSIAGVVGAPRCSSVVRQVVVLICPGAGAAKRHRDCAGSVPIDVRSPGAPRSRQCCRRVPTLPPRRWCSACSVASQSTTHWPRARCSRVRRAQGVARVLALSFGPGARAAPSTSPAGATDCRRRTEFRPCSTGARPAAGAMGASPPQRDDVSQLWRWRVVEHGP